MYINDLYKKILLYKNIVLEHKRCNIDFTHLIYLLR